MRNLIGFLSYIGICISGWDLPTGYFLALVFFTVVFGVNNYKEGTEL